MRVFIDTGLRVSGLAGLRYDLDDESANDVFLAQRWLHIRAAWPRGKQVDRLRPRGSAGPKPPMYENDVLLMGVLYVAARRVYVSLFCRLFFQIDGYATRSRRDSQ